MEWCEIFYEGVKTTEKSARMIRILIVLLGFGIVAGRGYCTEYVRPEIVAEYLPEENPAEETAAAGIMEKTVPAEIAAEPDDGAADKGVDIPAALSVWEIEESVLPAYTENISETEAEVALPPAVDEPALKVPEGADEMGESTTVPIVPGNSEPEVPAMPEEPEIEVPAVPGNPEAILPPATDSTDDPGVSVPLAIDGFLVDESGMICGVTDSLLIEDGCMVLPSEGCMGIASGAFIHAPGGICEIYIPANITYIAQGAFAGLAELEWFETAPSGVYCTEDGVLLSDGGTCILSFPAARTGSYKVPAKVTRFAPGAFDGACISTIDAVDCSLTDTGGIPETIQLLQK